MEYKKLKDMKELDITEMRKNKSGEEILMSHDEFVKGGKDIKGIPITITPNGEAPKELEDGNYSEISSSSIQEEYLLKEKI